MQKLVKFWEKQAWLDKPGAALSKSVSKIRSDSVAGRRLADFLHGRWLGHPLHPVLTDVPIGAFLLALIVDMANIGKRRSTGTATTAVFVGVIGSLPTAAAGIMDWHHLFGPAKRVGAGHATMNSLALGCYVVSLASRLSGHSGRVSAALGLGLMSGSAYLGGDMVYRQQIGVAHLPDEAPPTQMRETVSLDDLTEGVPRRVEAGDYPIMLLRQGTQIYALGDVCPHLGCSLSTGEVKDGTVTCACHGSSFSFKDGSVLSGPSQYGLPVFKTEVREGRVWVGA